MTDQSTIIKQSATKDCKHDWKPYTALKFDMVIRFFMSWEELEYFICIKCGVGMEYEVKYKLFKWKPEVRVTLNKS